MNQAHCLGYAGFTNVLLCRVSHQPGQPNHQHQEGSEAGPQLPQLPPLPLGGVLPGKQPSRPQLACSSAPAGRYRTLLTLYSLWPQPSNYLNGHSQGTVQLPDKRGLLANVYWMAMISLTGRHCQLSCSKCRIKLQLAASCLGRYSCCGCKGLTAMHCTVSNGQSTTSVDGLMQ